ncbi:MAG: ECF-type sigma factor [Planctomycetota bacterium]
MAPPERRPFDGGATICRFVSAVDPDLTIELLRRAGAGDTEARQQLVPRLAEELRRVASRHLGDGMRAVTLQPTLLVDEAWLRFFAGEGLAFGDRRAFLAFASKVMRNVLVDAVRARRAEKRGAGAQVALSESTGADAPRGLDLLDLDEALAELAGNDPEAARIVELRFFGGLSLSEIALELGLSERTVDRRWRFARAWLANRLEP